eukprot:CAMPEP_0204115722 /NCGR_PEP_ID=MMETSP0361-20130328/4989_1 /ASSEMBLY_ACC=CAM_ASM_000343 /TAXON_ID=268821 /ORGANISM="Scrippsiella Hangoei, Strain SHTV-5" /LENGTH=94 /DNA_ID=CAMNT_0051066409 /DNA_START=234 /DNA_END=519 /DNA_ORIENTATION=-
MRSIDNPPFPNVSGVVRVPVVQVVLVAVQALSIQSCASSFRTSATRARRTARRPLAEHSVASCGSPLPTATPNYEVRALASQDLVGCVHMPTKV